MQDDDYEDHDIEFMRRSKRIRKETQRYTDSAWLAAALSVQGFIENDPKSMQEAKQRSDWTHWKNAINDEYQSLINNNTWTLCELPTDRKPVACKWVFKLKRKANGEIDKYKARLVARGFSQRAGFDYNETYAPVARLTTVRILLSIANHHNMEIHQMDVKCAFLNGELNEEIYMLQPEGYEKGNKVCKLIKAIYGLKQASRMWNQKFNEFMMRIGFKRCVSDQCLYIKNDANNRCYILLYVDDLLIINDNIQHMQTIKRMLSSTFQMTDIGEVNNFLGMHIERNKEKRTMSIYQAQYLRNILSKFGMKDCKPISTPMEVNLDLRKVEGEPNSKIPYRELMGSLTYVTLTTRPDLCAATNYFGRFQSCYDDTHFRHAKRVLRYIQKTIDLSMVYNRDEKAKLLIGYTDADWANDKNDRKSVSGYVFKVMGNTVSWSSHKQPTVSLSSTEAEYLALAYGICEAKWLRSILMELGFDLNGPTIIFKDNQSCIQIARESRDHKRLKHVDIKFNFIRDALANGEIELQYTPSADQLADIMTKPISNISFSKDLD